MAQTNQDYLQQIHSECNQLITDLQLLNPQADNVYLNQKMAILREIPRLSSVEDIMFYLNTPMDMIADETNRTYETNLSFLKKSNAQFSTQARIYYSSLQKALRTEIPNLHQLPVFWLGLIALWYFQSVINLIICGAVIVFGFFSLSAINQLNRNAAMADSKVTAHLPIIEAYLHTAQQAELRASVAPIAPRAEPLIETILSTDYEPDVFDGQQNSPLHTLLHARLTTHSFGNTGRMRAAIEKLQHLKYHRNAAHTTPLFALQESDPYNLRPLFKLDHLLNIGSTFVKIEAFFAVFKQKPLETQRFLLLEGPPGTGKSATVMQYLGTQKNCVIQEWVVGSESDQWRSQLEARITTTFKTLITSAKANPRATYILYIDKIESVCPAVTSSGDQPSSKTSTFMGVAEQFQRNIETIRKTTSNVLVVATTTSPLSLSRSMRNLGQRILFALPTYDERLTLLTHFFIEKQISETKIRHIAALTDGWPPQALAALVGEIVEKTVDDAAINRAYDRVAGIIENDFKQIHPSGELYLPRWKNETDDSEYQVLTPRSIEACFVALQDYLHNQDYYTRTPMHVLLSGPPGGGKTTAVRNFSKQSKVAFILVKSGIMEFEMTRLLEQANRYDRVLFFVDEIDQCSCLNVLQTQMDGFKSNNTIIIGATNHPGTIQLRAALWSRFKYKIEVPALDNEQRGQYISWIIRKELERNPRVPVDESLEQDLNQNCPALTRASEQKDMRRIGWDLQTMFGQRRSAYARAQNSTDHDRSEKSAAITLGDAESLFVETLSCK